MKLGLCAPLECAALVKRLGYDYLEPPLCTIAEMTETAFNAAMRLTETMGMPCEAFNLLFPAGMTLIGPRRDLKTIAAYSKRAFRRARSLGGVVVVFGSGGARKMNGETEREEALNQLSEVCRILGDEAVQADLLVAVEPLNHYETDLVNTLEDGAVLVSTVGHPAVQLLADYYHMQREAEPLENLVQNGGVLCHCHIACGTERTFPHAENEALCKSFLTALKDADYQGRLSVEGVTGALERDAEECLALLRKLTG